MILLIANAVLHPIWADLSRWHLGYWRFWGWQNFIRFWGISNDRYPLYCFLSIIVLISRVATLQIFEFEYVLICAWACVLNIPIMWIWLYLGLSSVDYGWYCLWWHYANVGFWYLLILIFIHSIYYIRDCLLIILVLMC